MPHPLTEVLQHFPGCFANGDAIQQRRRKSTWLSGSRDLRGEEGEDERICEAVSSHMGV